MKKRSLLFCLSALVTMFFVEGVQAFATGPPINTDVRFNQVCVQMFPGGHGTLELAQPGSGGFLIDTDLPLMSAQSGYNYTAGQTYTVTLTGTMNTFRGFLVIAHVPGQNNVLIGQFVPQNGNQQNIGCDPAGTNNMASITHNNPSSQNFQSQTFMWRAPGNADGMVNFRYTVVQTFSVYYVAQNAAQNGPPAPAQEPTPPERDPEEYQLIFRTPPDCNLTNCTTYVGIDINAGNNGFLDIYMEGEALGWVAVGFTPTRNMFTADVVGCNRDPMTNMVEALDTYNAAAPNRNNQLDTTQDVILFNSSINETRITCTVSKQIAPTDPTPQDLNLNTNLFVLWGVSDNSVSSMGLATHRPESNPAASNTFINPSTGVLVSFPVRNPLDYRLIFREPSGCEPSQCRIFIGIDTNTGNNSFLDIYMEGEASGWIAVGFSDTQSMFAADVVGCNRDSDTDMVEVVDTWNPRDSRGNILDNTQNVIRFLSAFNNNRINCTIAKQISASGTGEDLDLNTDLFVMFGVRPDDAPGLGSLRVHTTGPGGNPLVSSGRWNPAVDSGEGVVFPKGDLLRAHGIIMLIAWPLLAVSGIFFAAWMRPALPNGEWFQIHRAFLLASMFVGAIGFILAFVAHAQNPIPGLINLESANPVGIAHYVIGIIVMFMHILNPLIAACRCHPGDKYRWVFNLLHGSTIGLLAELLALINISLGLSRFGALSFFRDLTIFWIFIGYLIFITAVIGVLFLIFTLLSVFSNDDDRQKTAPSLIKPLISTGAANGQEKAPIDEGVELAVPGQKPSAPSDAPAKPKVPSKDSPLRWGALTIFLAVNVVVMLILLILIAIE